MLIDEHRLKKDKDFELVFKEGKVFSSDFLFLKLKRNNLQTSRFGFIISKKISKKSTFRNKVKRRLRETIRKNLDNIKQGFDVIIGVRAEILDKDYQEVCKEIESLLKKAKLYI